MLFINCDPRGVVLQGSYCVLLMIFSHVSVVYLSLGVIILHIFAPPQVFCFKKILQCPQEDHQTCDTKYIKFEAPNAILQENP